MGRLFSGLTALGLILVGAALACAHLAPHAAWARAVTTWPVAAHALAFPTLAGALALLLALLTLIGAAMTRSRMHAVTAGTAALVVMLAATLIPWRGAGALAPAGPGELRILEWNTHGEADADDLGAFFDDWDPDVIVLPEGVDDAPDRSLADVITDAGQDPQRYLITEAHTPDTGASVAVIVRRSLGQYRVDEAALARFGSILLTPVDPGSGLPTIVGVHTAPPLPGLMDAWEEDLTSLAATLAEAPGPTILAGDFNAQTYHGALASLRGVEDAEPSGLGGTWPRKLPLPLRAHIDHIMVSGALRVTGARYVATTASDHSAIIASVAH